MLDLKLSTSNTSLPFSLPWQLFDEKSRFRHFYQEEFFGPKIRPIRGPPQLSFYFFKCSTQTSDIKQTLMPFSLLRQLFAMTGGHDSDTFKQLSAAFTVLRSLGSAQTAANRESSRIGHFIEAQVSDGELYRTKIHCYFLDQVSNLIQVFIVI